MYVRAGRTKKERKNLSEFPLLWSADGETRTRTGKLPLPPQSSASAIPPPPHIGYAPVYLQLLYYTKLIKKCQYLFQNFFIFFICVGSALLKRVISYLLCKGIRFVYCVHYWSAKMSGRRKNKALIFHWSVMSIVHCIAVPYCIALRTGKNNERKAR